MNIVDVLDHNNREQANGVIDRELGYHVGSVNGWGKKSFSVSLKSGNSLGLEFRVDVMRKNAKVYAYYYHPCLGLPLERKRIPLEGTSLEVMRVDKESDFGVLVSRVYSASCKSRKMIEKKYGKLANESNEAKGLWLCTI